MNCITATKKIQFNDHGDFTAVTCLADRIVTQLRVGITLSSVRLSVCNAVCYGAQCRSV